MPTTADVADAQSKFPRYAQLIEVAQTTGFIEDTRTGKMVSLETSRGKKLKRRYQGILLRCNNVLVQ